MSFKVVFGTAKQHSILSLFMKKSRKSYSWKCLCHMKHDSNAVHTFIEKVLSVLEIKYPML